ATWIGVLRCRPGETKTPDPEPSVRPRRAAGTRKWATAGATRATAAVTDIEYASSRRASDPSSARRVGGAVGASLSTSATNSCGGSSMNGMSYQLDENSRGVRSSAASRRGGQRLRAASIARHLCRRRDATEVNDRYSRPGQGSPESRKLRNSFQEDPICSEGNRKSCRVHGHACR